MIFLVMLTELLGNIFLVMTLQMEGDNPTDKPIDKTSVGWLMTSSAFLMFRHIG